MHKQGVWSDVGLWTDSKYRKTERATDTVSVCVCRLVSVVVESSEKFFLIVSTFSLNWKVRSSAYREDEGKRS